MTSRILITGGSSLLALNCAIVLRDSFDVSLVMHRRQIKMSGTRNILMDMGSIDSIKKVLDEIQPDLVIHTAGLTNVEHCELKPDLARYVNVELSVNLASACSRFGVSLIHVSTDHLFLGDKPFVDETAIPSPLNVYGQTKSEAENCVLDVNPRALVVRTNFYGWGTSYRQSFSDMVISNLRLGMKIRLFKDVYFSPILIEPLLMAAIELIEKNAAGIFNLVGDDRVSKYEFGIFIAEKFDLNKALILPGFISDEPSLIRRPHDMSLSNQKASQMLHRRIGGISHHLEELKLQEQNGIAQELKRL
jgi:dTDP-4-dehydrorhamnose reductase